MAAHLALGALALAALVVAAPARAAAPRAGADTELDALLQRIAAVREPASTRLRARVSSRKVGSSAPPQVLQVLIKTRREDDGARAWIYEVLWPKSLAGWSQSIRKASDGTLHVTRQEPGGQPSDLGSSGDVALLPGVTMTLADVMEDFRTWPIHERIGTEIVDKRDCMVVVFRKKASGGPTVKAWIARREGIVVRVEHLDAASAITRRVAMSRIVKTDEGWVAGGLRVEDVASGSESEIEFSRGNDAARLPTPSMSGSVTPP